MIAWVFALDSALTEMVKGKTGLLKILRNRISQET